ncbi:MAG: transposase domain-containing protein [Novosphingobium sp.]|uniref:transposase domain-containing protein n=1 Tax=Novosphingobium sp. TaxID=1874826 RepID=UPI00273281EE|nr:transposase domain-containing protein [Novosphingobium sp.]MDP3551130.1 transposase domain-containing protein [Novosphingobium sp.]
MQKMDWWRSFTLAAAPQSHKSSSLYTTIHQAAINSLVEAEKSNGIEPQTRIADVLAKLASGWSASRRDELMPWKRTAGEQSLIGHWLPKAANLP